MPKLLWVALPLLIGAALVALHAVLRRRAPSRQALNVWSSLLLAAYVSTTAGLGIFWVANQQLPVFDWHYLFGYMTVLLVALHLAFNFRVAWRHLTRRPGDEAAAPSSQGQRPAPGRRRWLGAIGVLFATGTAFVLGLRHGRTELQLQWPAAGGDNEHSASAQGRAQALALVERYHAFSSHTRTGVLMRAPGVDWGDPPPPFKRYPGAPRIGLAAAASGTAPWGLQALGTLLWHTAGVTDARGPVKLRASPSSGALFSTELYVAARAVAGLPPGLWHYDAQAHALERLAAREPADAALGALFEAAPHDASALIVATAVLRRTGHKYRDRSYRYVLADLGHALENLLVAADASGAAARLVERFDESRVAATLALDEGEEAVLALVALRPLALAGPPWAASLPQAAQPRPSEARWLVPPPPAEASLALGVTSAMHQASSLRAAAAELPAAAAGAAPQRPAPSAASVQLPLTANPAADALALIAGRRSVRRFAPTPLALQALAGVLAGMSGDPGVPGLSAAVRVHVIINAVAGLASGAYRYDSAAHRLVAQRANADLRSAARAAALDQDVIGGAAVVFLLAIERAAFAADAGGPARGYRHAFIEAGRVGERIYLGAAARGLGVCAVGAFYDQEAAALLALDPASQWVVHFAALGMPAA